MAARCARPARRAVATLGAVIALSAWVGHAAASDCARTSVGLVPLTDVAAGTYQGFQGGLYPGGANQRPAAHQAAGLAIANALVPLDTLGNPDPANGRIVLISIGMSNCTMEFSAFVNKVKAYPGRHPDLLVIDCALGGQSANVIRSPSAAYWDTVATRLRGHGSSPAQVQSCWIKEANSGPRGGFPAATDTLLWNLGAVVRILHQKLPNLRLAYLTSRIYAGYATTTLNPEPYAYESGFAVKWLIEAQINGVDSLNFDPGRGTVRAPWLSWGPYLWADGLAPRSDGMTWACDAFNSDGTHPSPIGRGIVADSLLRFFEHDATTQPWFLAGPLAVPAPPASGVSLAVAPNPANSFVRLSFAASAGVRWRLDVLDVAGRVVRVLDRGIGRGGTERRSWDARDEAGTRVVPGLYWLRVTSAGEVSTWRVAILGAP